MEAVPKMVREEDHQAEYDAADRWICSHPGVTHGDVGMGCVILGTKCVVRGTECVVSGCEM